MRHGLAVAVLALIGSGSLTAASFTNFYVFGDSLSDTGNLYQAALTDGVPMSILNLLNYDNGRATDGPGTMPAATLYRGVWEEQLAAMLGVPRAKAALYGGTNYAFADAETGTGTTPVVGNIVVPNVLLQVQFYIGSHTVDPNALYILWGGSNDILDAFDANPASTAGVPKTLVINMATAITALYQAGAKNFLWLSVPQLGNAPKATAQGPAAQAQLNFLALEAELNFIAAVARLKSANPGIHLATLDTAGLFRLVVANPASFGLTNVTDSAQGKSVNPDTYLFWDTLHPTTTGHHGIAQAAMNSITAEFGAQ